MRLNDAARAYTSSLLMDEWEQVKNIAPSGVEPPSFHRILSYVEFKATQPDLEMTDLLNDGTPSLYEMDPMYLALDGPAIRAAEKEGQGESSVTRSTLPGNQSMKRPREPVDARNDSEFQSQPAKRVVLESGSSKTWYARSVKECPMAPVVVLPKQTTGSGLRARTLQEGTSESRTRDPALQAGPHAVEMLSMSRVHAWNILIIGMCLNLGQGHFH